LREQAFPPDKQHHAETIFALGNGYLGTRGVFEEGYPGDTPATLVHGIYDHAPNTLVPELVNIPNWLGIRLTVDGTPFKIVTKTTDIMRPPEGYVLGYERVLDLKHGLLTRSVLFRAASGNIVQLIFKRFTSLDNPHLLCQQVEIVSAEGNPVIQVEATLDGDVSNNGTRHWQPQPKTVAEGDTTGIEVTAAQSGYVVALASRLVSPGAVTSSASGLRVTSRSQFTLKLDEAVQLTKLTTIYTSRDVSGSPLDAALAELDRAVAQGWDALYQSHAAEWQAYWDTSDVEIEGDEDIQRALRFTTYHILIAAPREDEHVSIGAKTLSGLGYKGHVFWDTELFIVPPLILTHPDLARNLLMYRYHNLQGARNKAKANGYEGAMFPWESTDTGEETTPQWSDPQPDGTRIRIWTGDHEQHISTDITYATMMYWRWTGDDAFMLNHGAEIVLDTAVFWGSRVEERDGRFELTQQIGPDEYHENIDNSVFVNRMVVWHLETALDLLDKIRTLSPADADRLTAALGLTDERLAHWRDIIARMFIPFDAEKQIHIQFPGFFEMEYIPVPRYTPRTTSLYAILGHHRAVKTQVIKQADVVMLMALLGDKLAPREVLLNNWNTYYPRCDHGSSLSPAIHAWVAARLGLDDVAYDMLYHAAHIDLHDNKGNVMDGMHAAATGGVWEALAFGFLGLHIDEQGQLKTAPRLPAHWKSVTITVYYQGEKRRITATNPESVSLSAG
jgi:kojibiose phosphorylase